MKLKTSHLIAGGIALALGGWILSGQIGSSGTAPDEAASASAGKEAGTRAAPAKAEMSVRVRDSVAAPVEQELLINGKTAPGRSVQLRAETGGRIVELAAERGDLVNKGDLLVRLDPRDRVALVDQAEADLRRREIELAASRKLGEKGFQAETSVATAEVEHEAAKAALQRARLDLEHTAIRAPFAGVLDLRPVEIGDFVDIGDAIATVLDVDPFLVVGDIAESEIAGLEPGMAGSARLATGETVEGRIRYIARQAYEETRSFKVELEVANPENRLHAGVSAKLRLETGSAAAHPVSPALLTLNDDGELGIKSVDGDDRVAFHPARILRSDENVVWLGDLPDRLRLITVGQGFVRPGDKVRPMPEKSAGEGPLLSEARG
jgi:multidrug efflux system membrane fusion protein